MITWDETKRRQFEDEIEALLSDEKAFFKRFRRLEGEELARHRELIASARGKKKERVTIYFDPDVIGTFRSIAARQGIGYQTLMNQALRNAVLPEPNSSVPNFKDEMLKDKKFIKKLRAALAERSGTIRPRYCETSSVSIVFTISSTKTWDVP